MTNRLVSNLAMLAVSGMAAFTGGCQDVSERSAGDEGRTGQIASALPACSEDGVCGVNPNETEQPTSITVNPHACYNGPVEHTWAIHQATNVFRYVSAGYLQDERDGTGKANAPWHQWYWACANGDAGRNEMDARADEFINAVKTGACRWGSPTTAIATVCTNSQAVSLAVRRLDCGKSNTGFGIYHNTYQDTLTMGTKMKNLQNAIGACYPGSEQFFALRMRRFYANSAWRHEYYVDPDNAMFLSTSSPYKSYSVDGTRDPAGTENLGRIPVITWYTGTSGAIWYSSYSSNARITGLPDSLPCVTTTTYAGSQSTGFMTYKGKDVYGRLLYACW